MLSFAMIAGISFTGYQMSQSRDERNDGLQTDANINQKMIELFGHSGVLAGGNFLKHVMLRNEVTFTHHLHISYRLKRRLLISTGRS